MARTFDIWLRDDAIGLDVPRDSGGMVCTGIVKLTQRFINYFATEIGSDPFEINKGTRVTGIKIASVVATAQIEHEITKTLEYIQRNTPEDAPDNEVLLSAQLDYMSIVGDRVYVRIVLVTQAGDMRSLELPTGLVIT